MTNIGLQITAQIDPVQMKWMLLNCYDREDPTKAILLNLRYASHLRLFVKEVTDRVVKMQAQRDASTAKRDCRPCMVKAALPATTTVSYLALIVNERGSSA